MPIVSSKSAYAAICTVSIFEKGFKLRPLLNRIWAGRSAEIDQENSNTSLGRVTEKFRERQEVINDGKDAYRQLLQLLPSLVEEALLSDHINPNLMPPLVIITTDSWKYTYHPFFSKGSEKIYNRSDSFIQGSKMVDGEFFFPAPIFLFGAKRLALDGYSLNVTDLDFTLIGYSLRKLKYFLQTGAFDGISENERFRSYWR